MLSSWWLLGRRYGTRVLIIDGFGLATVTDVGYRHQPGEVTRSQQKVLHLIVGPIELHCNRYGLVVATSGRRGSISWFDHELGHA